MGRRVILTLAAFLTFISFIALSQITAFAEVFAAVVDTADKSGAAPLYSKASTSSSVIGRYRNGVQLQVLEQSGNWSRVTISTRDGFRSVTGYMLSTALTPDDGTQSSSFELPQGVITYSQGYGLKLRERAESSASPLGEYPKGTAVTVLSKGGDWLHVEVEGITGFMLAKYISINDTVDSVAAQPPDAFAFAWAASAFMELPEPLPVYSGPGLLYLRGGNDKAAVATSEIFYFYGFDMSSDDGAVYACIRYETSGGAQRIGYIRRADLRDDALFGDIFDNFLTSEPASITKSCAVTDDPLGKQGNLTNVRSGVEATLLGTIRNGTDTWAYIEGVDDSGRLFRGFVPYKNVSVGDTEVGS
ncbi:MAG: SH3 domain-containing protein [Oscillospiraceae bacterium]|nr:SH3 domain-containing protein [Oscillospiraceae bacterium]